MINQTIEEEGTEEENGIRTNVYFNQVVGTIRRERRVSSGEREDGNLQPCGAKG